MERVIPVPQKPVRAAPDDHAIPALGDFGHYLFEENGEMFGVQHLQLGGIDACLEAAAHEGLDQPVEHGVQTLFALRDHLLFAFEAASDFGGDFLIPKLPAEPVRDRPGDIRGTASVFAFYSDDLNHGKLSPCLCKDFIPSRDTLKTVLLTIGPQAPERPKWLRAPAPVGQNYRELKELITDLNLHTVCESAACPNVGECWNRRTATFMILGNVCTRRCGFCAVQKGGPLPVDYDEPRRVAEAVAIMGLRYAVVTSVNRDDRKDGGAELFQLTIDAIRERVPGCKVEVLVPDFQGSQAAMKIVMDARPDVLNHNTETVPRLYRQVRLGARYERSLEMLKYAKELRPETPVKSGLMLGLGETQEEVLQVMRDLHDHRVDILTLGQYLRPSPKHLPIVRYVPPAEFDDYRRAGAEMGFAHVEAGPLVRSSYHADDSHAAALC
jgi:lipoyl synthase